MRPRTDLTSMVCMKVGMRTARPESRSTSKNACAEAGMALMGPEKGSEPLRAARFRFMGSDLIRIADGPFWAAWRRLGHDEDLAVGTCAARVRY